MLTRDFWQLFYRLGYVVDTEKIQVVGLPKYIKKVERPTETATNTQSEEVIVEQESQKQTPDEDNSDEVDNRCQP